MDFRVFAFALGVALTSSAAIAGPEPVEIPDGDLTLHATLYRPDGPGPFPAVVALHDCGGLKQRPNTEAQLYSIWANKLVADGFVVLFPDSFESRGLGSQCRERHRSVRASPTPTPRGSGCKSRATFGPIASRFWAGRTVPRPPYGPYG